jgi:hypothetical protein
VAAAVVDRALLLRNVGMRAGYYYYVKFYYCCYCYYSSILNVYSGRKRIRGIWSIV